MNICIATDDNYAGIMAVLMISILENSNEPQNLNFHIFEYGVKVKTKNALKNLCDDYQAALRLYSIGDYINTIKKNINSAWANNNSYVAYARLYMSDLLDDTINQFIYLDCDTLVLENLDGLDKVELKDNVIAAVKDVLPYTYKKWMGFDDGDYFNSGVSVINAKKWRDENMTKVFFDYCKSHPEDIYPDQDAINTLLKGRTLTLPPKYCVFYPEYSWSPESQLKGYCGDESTFYRKSELKEAGERPAIIHFTDTVLGRPWQSNNINPNSKQWMKYYNMLPKELKTNFKAKDISWKTSVFRMLYKILPSELFCKIYYKRRNDDMKRKMEGKYK